MSALNSPVEAYADGIVSSDAARKDHAWVRASRLKRRSAMKLCRRRFLQLAVGAATLPAVSRLAKAQAYPTRPVRMIVADVAPGGAGRHRRAH